MNPETNNRMIESNANVTVAKIPHPVNQVTTISKYLALALFIFLPFIGGYIGYVYAPDEIMEESIQINHTIVRNIDTNQVNQSGESLYYFASYDDVVEYMSSVADPHLDWKNKVKDKLKVIENVTFSEPDLLDTNERYSLYFVLTSSTSDELIFSRGSLIKGGEPIGIYTLSKSDNKFYQKDVDTTIPSLTVEVVREFNSAEAWNPQQSNIILTTADKEISLGIFDGTCTVRPVDENILTYRTVLNQSIQDVSQIISRVYCGWSDDGSETILYKKTESPLSYEVLHVDLASCEGLPCTTTDAVSVLKTIN